MMQGMRKFLDIFVVLLFIGLTFTPSAFAQNSELPGPSNQARVRPIPSAESQPPMSPSSLPVMAEPDENYRLGSGDKLKVTIYGEDDLSGEVTVDGSGQVQLPLIGRVKAAGLSVHEFVDEITKAYEDGYLKGPRISAEIENYRPFYIMGEVNKPGEYPYENGLSVLGAVALAGGFTYRADSSEVYIRHAGNTKEVTVPANATEKIAPGDIIRIDERIF